MTIIIFYDHQLRDVVAPSRSLGCRLDAEAHPLIAFTIMLALFVSLSAIQYRMTAVAIAACFTTGIVSILVIARLLDYPFEGGLALRPTDFIEVIGKVSDLLNHVNVSEH